MCQTEPLFIGLCYSSKLCWQDTAQECASGVRKTVHLLPPTTSLKQFADHNTAESLVPCTRRFCNVDHTYRSTFAMMAPALASGGAAERRKGCVARTSCDVPGRAKSHFRTTSARAGARMRGIAVCRRGAVSERQELAAVTRSVDDVLEAEESEVHRCVAGSCCVSLQRAGEHSRLAHRLATGHDGCNMYGKRLCHF